VTGVIVFILVGLSGIAMVALFDPYHVSSQFRHVEILMLASIASIGSMIMSVIRNARPSPVVAPLQQVQPASPAAAPVSSVRGQPQTDKSFTPQQALDLAKQLYSQGKFDASGQLLDRLLLYKPVRPEALYCLGLVNMAQNRDVSAAGNLLQASIEDPNNANVLYYLGRISERHGDKLTAAEMYAASLDIDPNHRSALARLAQI
jgi:tetratricopeptide (TPR) repeat protein